ncbi:hypothetical protein SAMN02787142_4903 [Burkholderia sp. WP9]|nr:hypothetical protein SAMN02787142_4903 [Burkholderia sp. WP9]
MQPAISNIAGATRPSAGTVDAGLSTGGGNLIGAAAGKPLTRSSQPQFDNDTYGETSGVGGNGCKPVCLLKLYLT